MRARKPSSRFPYVFTSRAGGPVEPRNMLRNFHRQLGRARVPRRRFHDLRHTFATLMLTANVHHRVVMEILGHSSISTTLDLYSHVSLELQRDAMIRFDSVAGLGEAPSERAVYPRNADHGSGACAFILPAPIIPAFEGLNR